MIPNFPALCAQADLVRRWTYTREGLRQLIARDPRFPQPIATVNNGKTRLWLTSDIEDYERSRPWLTDPTAKQRYRAYLYRRNASLLR